MSADHGVASGRADDLAALLAEFGRLAHRWVPGRWWSDRARLGGCGAGLHPVALCAEEG